ncbi:MAG: hypothetical protein ABL958_16470 [Bdellovibrionia bacterium]
MRKVSRNLAAKKGELNFSTREPMVKSVLAELQSRIASGQLTYEYMYALSFRLGFLLEMNGEIAKGESTLYRPIELPIVFDAQNYLTHEAFMKMVNTASKYKADGAYRSSIFKEWLQEMNSDSKVLTLFGDLGYRTLNLLISRDVWPVGIVTSVKHVDGSRLDELQFPYHDYAHFAARRTFYARERESQIPYHMIRSFDRMTLDKIEASAFSETDFTLLQFLHYNTFHESTGTAFVLLDANGAWKSTATGTHIRNGMNKILEMIQDNALEIRNDGNVLVIQEELNKLLVPIMKHL